MLGHRDNASGKADEERESPLVTRILGITRVAAGIGLAGKRRLVAEARNPDSSLPHTEKGRAKLGHKYTMLRPMAEREMEKREWNRDATLMQALCKPDATLMQPLSKEGARVTALR